MAIFEREEGKVLSGPGTVIGANVKLMGALKDVNDISVHGTIEGEVASEKNVTIGETAQVKGPVSGATVSISGTVRGSVEAANRLELLATGKVHGNISAKELIIRSGAVFNGKSTMIDKEAKGAKVEALKEEDETIEEVIVDGPKAEYEVE